MAVARMKLFNVIRGIIPFVDLASRNKRLPKNNKGQYFIKNWKNNIKDGPPLCGGVAIMI
jgi:hypothetical protein